jgi:DNA-binding Xre family transcriptional regulator
VSPKITTITEGSKIKIPIITDVFPLSKRWGGRPAALPGEALATQPQCVLSCKACALCSIQHTHIIWSVTLGNKEVKQKHSVGERVRLLRQGRGWTQRQLEQRSGLERAFLSRLENGRTDLTLSSLEKIAGAFGLSVSELLKGL